MKEAPLTIRTRTFEVQEAFEMALARTRRGPSSRKDWLRDQIRFLEWLARVHPQCAEWHMINRHMLREYLADELSSRSPNGQRLAFQPIVQTARFMQREHEVPNVAENLGIGTALVRPTAVVYLADVVAFLDWLTHEEPRLEAGAALQGLGGLQMQEALRLTWDKVDVDRGLIEISGEVKNEYRNRVIPICQRVKSSLARARRTESGSLIEIHEAVVLSPERRSYAVGIDSWRNYSRAIREGIRRWNSNVNWAPKDLRNCLPTFAECQGIRNGIWEQYIGHAPKTVTARHYVPRLASGSLGEADALKDQMDLFRFQVIRPLEVALAGDSTGKILNFFEREADSAPREAVQNGI